MARIFIVLISLCPLLLRAQANPTGDYAVTSGTSLTLSNDASVVRFNPASAMSAFALTLPASPSDRQTLKVLFGGTVANGQLLISALTLSPNSGQAIVQASIPSQITSGDYLIYYYDAKTSKWFKTAGVTQSQLALYLKATDTTVFARATPIFTNSPSRSFNTGYIISSSRSSRVSYTVQTAVTLSLVTVAGVSQAYLEISPNNSTWTTINSCGTSETLGIGVSVTKTNLYNIQGDVPANWYCRMRAVTSGGGSITFSSGQETTY